MKLLFVKFITLLSLIIVFVNCQTVLRPPYRYYYRLNVRLNSNVRRNVQLMLNQFMPNFVRHARKSFFPVQRDAIQYAFLRFINPSNTVYRVHFQLVAPEVGQNWINSKNGKFNVDRYNCSAWIRDYGIYGLGPARSTRLLRFNFRPVTELGPSTSTSTSTLTTNQTSGNFTTFSIRNVLTTTPISHVTRKG